MSLFRKPKRSFQRRILIGDDEEEDNQGHSEASSMPYPPAPPRISKEQPGSGKKPLLSFETEEDDGEVFQVRKSSHNRKVMKMFKKQKEEQRKQSKDSVQIKQNHAPSIPKERFDPPSTSVNVPTSMLILSGRDALCAGKNDMSDEDDGYEDNYIEDGLHASHRHRFSRPDNFKKVLESGAIPDAAMIHAARKKRQKAREMGDIIPLEEPELEDKGRLARDEDHEESDEERIDMDVNLSLRDQEKRKEQFLTGQSSDQEMDDWENQQLRKGVTSAGLQDYQQQMFGGDYTSMMGDNTTLTSVQADGRSTNLNNSYKSTDRPQTITIRSPSEIAEKLRQHYIDICTSRDNNLKQLDDIRDAIVNMETDLQQSKAQAPLVAERFKFYQILRGYVMDLVECLDEKVAAIADLESRALQQMSNRAEWLIERRRQDVRDQAEEATSGGANSNSSKMQSIDDEQKIRRAAEREGRRTRRRRAREHQNGTTILPQSTIRHLKVNKHVEGMSSDDEISPQNELHFSNERRELENEVETLLSSTASADIAEEFSNTMASMLIRMEQWREHDPPTYTDAYVTQCLPKMVSPWVRLHLVFWNPLESEGTKSDFELFPWYRTLALYGLHDDETQATLEKDVDVHLVPNVVEKVIVPKLSKLVERCWDPMSSTQTLRLVGVVSRLIRKYPTLGPSSQALINLFQTIVHRMQLSLENDIFIPITMAGRSTYASSTASIFFQRQFAGGAKLLKNIASWQGIINDDTLKELALKGLLNRYLLSAIKVCSGSNLPDAIDKVSLVTMALPRIWLQQHNQISNSGTNYHQSDGSRSNASELTLFADAVYKLSQKLDRKNPMHLSAIELATNVLRSFRS